MMRDRFLGQRELLYALVAWGILISLWPAPTLGAPLPPRLSQEDPRDKDLETLRLVLETKTARSQLEALGITTAEVEAKLAQLSPEELHELAQRAEEVRAGGQAGAGAAGVNVGVGIFILGLLIVIVLIVVLLRYWTSPRGAPTPGPLVGLAEP